MDTTFDFSSWDGSWRDETDSPLGLGSPPCRPDLMHQLRLIAATLPPGVAFSHATAASIFGWPIPWRAEVCGDVHVMSTAQRGAIRRYGIVGHTGLDSRAVIEVDGLPVVSRAHTWVDLGELSVLGGSYTIEDLVIAGDQALKDGCTRAQLCGIVHQRTSPRGKRNLVPALYLIRRGSESGGETRWRLVLYRVGLPEPLLNINVFDHAGTFLLRTDLGWRAKRVGSEYQGAAWHDNPAAIAADSVRFGRGERGGWRLFEARSPHIWVPEHRDAAVLELADALQFPAHRLDLAAGEPTLFSSHFAQTMIENRERTRRRQRAAGLSFR